MPYFDLSQLWLGKGTKSEINIDPLNSAKCPKIQWEKIIVPCIDGESSLICLGNCSL